MFVSVIYGEQIQEKTMFGLGNGTCESENEEGTGKRQLDLAEPASIDLVALNNKIVSLRPKTKRVKVQTIHKLSRQIQMLKHKKGTPTQVEKTNRKAYRMIEEIKIAKNLKIDNISKYALATTSSFDAVCKQGDAPAETRILARLADHKLLKDVVKVFRSKHKDWHSLAAFLLTKNTGRRFKKKQAKKTRSAEANVKAKGSMVTTYLKEKLEGKLDVNKCFDKIIARRLKRDKQLHVECDKKVWHSSSAGDSDSHGYIGSPKDVNGESDDLGRNYSPDASYLTVPKENAESSCDFIKSVMTNNVHRQGSAKKKNLEPEAYVVSVVDNFEIYGKSDNEGAVKQGENGGGLEITLKTARRTATKENIEKQNRLFEIDDTAAVLNNVKTEMAVRRINIDDLKTDIDVKKLPKRADPTPILFNERDGKQRKPTSFFLDGSGSSSEEESCDNDIDNNNELELETTNFDTTNNLKSTFISSLGERPKHPNSGKLFRIRQRDNKIMPNSDHRQCRNQRSSRTDQPLSLNTNKFRKRTTLQQKSIGSLRESAPKSFRKQGSLKQTAGRTFDGKEPQVGKELSSDKNSKQSRLHPSWEASQKRKKEQSALYIFQGKKITFDDAD